MNKYTKVNWQNYEANSPTNTAINKDNLDHMDQGILDAYEYTDEYTDKAVADVKTAKIVDFNSDDRDRWLAEDGLIYQVQGGVSLGYPANYLVIVNSKRNFSLTTQLAYTTERVWTRAVNNNLSSMEWTPIHSAPSIMDFPFSPGWFNYETSSIKEDGWVKCRMVKEGNRVFVEGLAKCNPDAKAQVGVLPAGWRPKSIHMFSCMADTKTSVNSAVRVDVMTDGRVIVNHGTNAGMTTPVVFVALEFDFRI